MGRNGIASAVAALALFTATASLLACGGPVPRQLAATFDDLPSMHDEGATAARQLDINRRLVATLVARGIPAVCFVNEARLEDAGEVNPARVAALEIWLEAGLELGNHTYSHLSLHETPLADWLADVLRGERVTRRLLAERERPLRWFRHPYLHTGTSPETRRAALAFLAERGVRVAPVTLDNAEWIFARAYRRTREAGDEPAAERVADAYVEHMAAKLDYFERQARALFGRDIAQVLVVHANGLNADHFDRVAGLFESRGYAFVPLAEALEDEAYRSADTFTGPRGISWLHRWALSRGPEGAVLPDEPRPPDWVMATAER